jgi:hypothetical protein
MNPPAEYRRDGATVAGRRGWRSAARFLNQHAAEIIRPGQ